MPGGVPDQHRAAREQSRLAVDDHLFTLGQTAGQRALLALGGRIPSVVQQALTLPEAAWSNFAPGLALASSCHETQYSRLFRS